MIYNPTTIINNTYVYNNHTYVSGPRRSELERATGRRVAIREVNRSSRPGRASVSNRSVSLYRPEVERNSRSSARPSRVRSEEHTSELQSLMRISYAVFCLKKKNKYHKTQNHYH